MIWTLATASTAICHTFAQVLPPRIVFAGAQAACIPASISLINTYYGGGKALARANSIYSFGVYLGVGMSSISLILDKKLG